MLLELDDDTKEPTGRSLRRRVGSVVKTRDLNFWSQEDIDAYGYQVISLLEDAQ